MMYQRTWNNEISDNQKANGVTHIKKFCASSDHHYKGANVINTVRVGVTDSVALGIPCNIVLYYDPKIYCPKFLRNRQKGPRKWGLKLYSVWNFILLPTWCWSIFFHMSLWTEDMNAEVRDTPVFSIYANAKYIFKIVRKTKLLPLACLVSMHMPRRRSRPIFFTIMYSATENHKKLVFFHIYNTMTKGVI